MQQPEMSTNLEYRRNLMLNQVKLRCSGLAARFSKFFRCGGTRLVRVLALVAAVCMAVPAVEAAGVLQGTGCARFSWEAVADPIVTGYKVHWGLASGVYTHTYDAGNTTEVIIAAFAEGVTYFSAVTAYSSTGEESDYSEEISFVYDSSDRMVLLEAEAGALTSPMQILSDGTISWVASSPADPAAATTLSFEVPYAADYYVWCRVRAPYYNSDSLFVMVDQQPELVYDVYGEAVPPAEALKKTWAWSRIQVSPGTARAFALEGGSHSIRFRHRESTWLDRVIIVSNPDFVPTDEVPRSGDYVAVVGQPQGGVVAEGGAITLAANLVSTGPLTLEWYHDGVAIPASDQRALDFSNIRTAACGSYTLTAWRNATTVTTVPAIVTVLPTAGSPTFRVRTMQVTPVAGGGQVTFEVEGAQAAQLGVYASSDLVHWSLLTTQQIYGTTLTVMDPAAVGGSKRFYRLSDSGGS